MASGIPVDQIHTVKGVEMHLWNSFPSGHTATAFTLFLLTTYLFPKKTVLAIGALYAIACGYSRVYLGQHFPLDVAGGITVAIITILLSIYIRKNEKKNLLFLRRHCVYLCGAWVIGFRCFCQRVGVCWAGRVERGNGSRWGVQKHYQ